MATQTGAILVAVEAGVLVASGGTTYVSSIKTCSTGGYVSFAVAELERCILFLQNTSSTATSIVTIGSGVNYSGAGVAYGDITLASDSTYIVSGLDSTRCKASSGSVTVGTSGTVSVYCSGATVYMGLFQTDDK